MMAQDPDVKDLLRDVEEQESRLTFPHFTHDDAWSLGLTLVGMARDRDLPVTTDIRRGEQQVFHAALAGTTADNDDWIARKIRTVRRYEVSSLAVRLRHESTNVEADWLDPTRYAVAGGCVPVKLADGALVGTVSVSGLPDTDDHALVVEAMLTFLGAV